jgi:hypothetical protein
MAYNFDFTEELKNLSFNYRLSGYFSKLCETHRECL